MVFFGIIDKRADASPVDKQLPRPTGIRNSRGVTNTMATLGKRENGKVETNEMNKRVVEPTALSLTDHNISNLLLFYVCVQYFLDPSGLCCYQPVSTTSLSRAFAASLAILRVLH